MVEAPLTATRCYMTAVLTVLVALAACPASATAANVSLRNATADDEQGTDPIDIDGLSARYQRDAARLTLTASFVAPLPNPIPPGRALGFVVGSGAEFDPDDCRLTEDHDLAGTLASGPTGVPGFRFDDEAATVPTKPMTAVFSPDRTSLTATLQHPRLGARDYRCLEVTSGGTAPGTVIDSAFAPFRLPLALLKVRASSRKRSSSRRPGSTRLRISWTKQAAISLRVSVRGRTVLRREFSERRDPPRTSRLFRWRCSRTGRFRWKVTGRDEYGNRIVRRGSWVVSARRCAALRAAERRRAEARRLARIRRERVRREQETGDGGRGGCHPSYSPCLPITGDLDCADVNGPVTVRGTDPYRLDNDGDGVGCE